jgi:hypothetical protein
MFFGANTLWKTINGGKSWSKISQDLTRKTWDTPVTVGTFRDADTAKPTQRGVIYTVAPSYVDLNRIWIGTDDGLIQMTSDGGATWHDVTPPDLKPWMKVSIIDAGRFDANTAYAAINTLRLDDMHPHLYRTHDGGKTWTPITNGMPDNAPTDAIREDPKRKGLLFAGTERQVFVSFDDGDHWESLRLNMPATSIRDVIVHGDDLIAGTHGRGIWILDDITPLRQMAGLKPCATGEPCTVAQAFRPADTVLFKPQVAYRVRQNTNTDTPIPPDEAAGKNPPDGAIVNYALSRDAQSVTLEILDPAGAVIRHYSSEDTPAPPTAATAPVPLYWYRAPQPLAKTAGLHRFTWDEHYQSLIGIGGRGGAGGLPIAAVPHDTVPVPIAPWAAPGQYTVKLTVDGKSYTQPLTLKMDPRVKTPPLGLTQQIALSKQLYDGMQRAQQAAERARASNGELAQQLTTLVGNMNQLMQLLQGADATPTTQLAAAVGERRTELAKLLGQAAQNR